MVSALSNLTEAEILAQAIAPEEEGLPREVALALLSVQFREPASTRMRELLDRNNCGTLTPAEQDALDKYRRVGQFLDLMQAKARLSLKQLGD
jgi:hypothetical protein